MANRNDISKAMQNLVSPFARNPKGWFGIVGDGSGNVYPDVNDPFTIYVTDLSGQTFKIFNQRAPAQLGSYVMVGYDPSMPRLEQVLSLFNTWGSPGAFGLPTHHLTHEWGGADTVFLRGEAFTPGLMTCNNGFILSCYPTIIGTSTGGIVFFDLKSDGTVQTLDMTSHLPTTGAQLFAVCIKDDGTLAVVAGATKSTPELISLTTDMPAMPDATYHARYAVRMFAGQTSIRQVRYPVEYSDLYDLRWIGGGSGGGGAPSGPASGDLAGTYPNPTLASTVLNHGLHSARPTATGTGHYYFETDTTNLFQDTGAGVWTQIASIGGGSVTAGDGIAVSGSTVSQNIDNGTAVTSMADADEVGTWNAIANAFRKITWANFKASIKTYADTLYISIGGARTILTAARTYYVATTGNDSNDGLTSGTAFLTIQHADDVASALDNGGNNITIQVANGTYALGTSKIILKSFVGSGTIIIQGNTTTPSNVLITNTSGGVGFSASSVSGTYQIQGFKFSGSSSSIAIQAVGAPSTIYYKNIEFGAGYSWHIDAEVGAFIQCIGNYTISGSVTYNHALASFNGTIYIYPSGVITLSGTPNWGTAFVHSDRTGVMLVYGITFSGSATGKKALAETNGVVETLGGKDTYLPGSVAGTTATGGQYV
jgi:hypothetical protein